MCHKRRAINSPRNDSSLARSLRFEETNYINRKYQWGKSYSRSWLPSGFHSNIPDNQQHAASRQFRFQLAKQARGSFSPKRRENWISIREAHWKRGGKKRRRRERWWQLSLARIPPPRRTSASTVSPLLVLAVSRFFASSPWHAAW